MPQSLVTDLTPAQVGVFGGVQGARAMFGDSADRLIANNFDPGVLRPFIGPDGNNYMTLNAGTPQERTVVTNAPATLTWEAWKAFDDAIIRAIQDELRLFADIRAAGLELNIPNGMGHTVLQYQTSGDIGPATISMDPIRRSEGDQPTKDSALLPLPCTHKDFDFSARQIAVSQNGRIPMPVDTDTAALAAHQVAVATEQLTAGTIGSFSYGGGTIYGYTNFPNRATKTDMPVPTGANGPGCDLSTAGSAADAHRRQAPRSVYSLPEQPVGGVPRQRLLDGEGRPDASGNGSSQSRGSKMSGSPTTCRRLSSDACSWR
jgi:hypothetical protein